jgi:hypothetical protein
MATLKSAFGAYADKLQIVVDNSLDLFAPVWFERYFKMGVPQQTLTYTSALGASRIEAAASIIARGSRAPLRSRQALQKLSGEMPVISEKFAMKEEDYRNFLMLQGMSTVSDAAKKQQLLNFLFDDVKKVGDSIMKRLDWLCLEGVSTGKNTLSTTNNPDGIILNVDLDLGLPTANKTNAAVAWATSATATPITDFDTVITAANAKGVKFAKVLMHPTVWTNFRKAKEVTDALVGFFRLAKGTVANTLDNVNEFLAANRYPIIEIVDVSIGIEKDGVITASNPFSSTNAVFIPDGPLGEVKNAFSIEQLKPVDKISYATFKNALISKWGENEPWQEFTKGEFNAFPVIESINFMWLLSTTVAF